MKITIIYDEDSIVIFSMPPIFSNNIESFEFKQGNLPEDKPKTKANKKLKMSMNVRFASDGENVDKQDANSTFKSMTGLLKTLVKGIDPEKVFNPIVIPNRFNDTDNVESVKGMIETLRTSEFANILIEDINEENGEIKGVSITFN